MKKLLLTAGLFIVLAVVLGCISSGQTNTQSDAEKACTGSGGTVTTAMCCGSASDFPNSCLIGACGCSPSNSHSVKTCDCGEGKCFNGTGCIATQSSIVGAGATVGAPGVSENTGEFNVVIQNFQFNPPTATIIKGDTIVWTNNDTVPHGVVAYDQSFKSDTLQPGQSYSYTFTKAGTYAYHCSIHSSMRGTIIVQEAPPAEAQ